MIIIQDIIDNGFKEIFRVNDKDFVFIEDGTAPKEVIDEYTRRIKEEKCLDPWFEYDGDRYYCNSYGWVGNGEMVTPHIRYTADVVDVEYEGKGVNLWGRFIKGSDVALELWLGNRSQDTSPLHIYCYKNTTMGTFANDAKNAYAYARNRETQRHRKALKEERAEHKERFEGIAKSFGEYAKKENENGKGIHIGGYEIPAKSRNRIR